MQIAKLFAISSAAFILSGRAPVAAQGAPAAAPISEAELVQRLRARADSLAGRDEFSGVILLTKGDRTVFQGAYGFANRDAKRRNEVGTAFNYSSIGKLFTQAAVWQLVEAGKLSPDSTVGHYWPDYPNKEVARTVTIRELLDHRSGIGGDVFGMPPSGRRVDVRSTKDYVALFANEPMHFAAGTKQEYSNAGYVLLGALVERVSGESYYDYVRKHVFEPAGLTHTGFYAPDSLPVNAAIGYTKISPDGGTVPLQPNTPMLPGHGSAAGGGYSSVGDLERFAQALRDAKIAGFGKVRHGAMAGGSPGSNGIVQEGLPGGYDVVVLSNFDPPAAINIATTVRNWLLGRPATPDERARVGAGPPPSTAPSPAPPARGGAVDLSTTEAGRAAERYVRAFNTGDTVAMRSFFDTWVVPNPARTSAQRLETYRAMRDDLGDVTPASIAASKDDEISVLCHAAKGGDVTFTIAVEKAAPHRIVSIGVERD